MILWCHKEINGTIGTYPYGKISDEIQSIIQDHGKDDVKVYRLEPAKVSTASSPRRLPNGNVVWLHKELPAPWKPTDTLFSLNYPYNWGESLFGKICSYFASIPEMDGRWEVKIVDNDPQANWRVSAKEETYEFLLDQWGIIPNSDLVFLSACTAEQVKEWLLDAYEMKQRAQNSELKPYNPPRAKWLYIEKSNVIRYFYEESELAQYFYTSDTPIDGFVKLVFEDDHRKTDGVHETAKLFLARYEQFHPLFPPRDKEVPKRLQETRYIMEGEKCTAKDMWERCYRSQIDRLIRSGTENHIAALVLMMPCMELVYKLKTGKKKNWIETLKMFFPAVGFDQNTYKGLVNLIRNGFVHDGFTKGDVGISSAYHMQKSIQTANKFFWECAPRLDNATCSSFQLSSGQESEIRLTAFMNTNSGYQDGICTK